jgi:tetratricopeptide (TPR) repeat protein
LKILFLAANPVDVVARLRIDEEVREISHKIRLGTHRDQVGLVQEWAVRVRDLQEVLLRHQPDIVHFSGHSSPSHGIMLENDAGNRSPVSPEALSNLFSILKDNIRVIVLNACYGKEQAQLLSGTVDFTIGMNAAIPDRAAIIFSAHFYQSLAFGRSVGEAFDLAVNQLCLEGFDVAQVPELMVRDGANASQTRIVKQSRRSAGPSVRGDGAFVNRDKLNTTPGREVMRGSGGEARGETWKAKPHPFALLPWLLASLALSLATDMMRRFLGDGWPDSAALIVQSALIALAIGAAAIVTISMMRPRHPLVLKVTGSDDSYAPQNVKRPIILTGIALVVALGLWLSRPVLARYYNERGVAFQYREQPDLSRARESYQRAVRLVPDYAQANYDLATVQEDLLPEKAIEEYRLAIGYDSHIYAAYNNLARLYILRGQGDDYESALKLLSQVEDLSPQDDNVQYSLNKNRGWANLALKHYAMAEVYLRKAIALRSQESGAAAHCLLAYVLKEQGKAGVADECFDCVSLAPGEKDVESRWVSDAQECLKKGGSR